MVLALDQGPSRNSRHREKMSTFYCICALLVTQFALCVVNAQDTQECFPSESEFARVGCTCEGPSIRCEPNTRLSAFPVIDGTYNAVTEIYAPEQHFTELNKTHLESFPNLEDLELNRGRVSKISNDAFEANPKLRAIRLQDNRLTVFPPVRNLGQLDRLFLHDNSIPDIPVGALVGCYELRNLVVSNNDIRELKSGVFRHQCNLATLDLSDNGRLTSIDKDAFEDTGLLYLYLNNTGIDRLPTNGLRTSLLELSLSGTKNLKRFDAFEPGAEFNQTYPLLRKINFFYHAHCCQMRGHHYYTPPINGIRSVDQSTFHSAAKIKRQTPTTTSNSLNGYVCVNVSNESTVVDTSSVSEYQNISASEFCSSELCVSSVCGDRCSHVSSQVPFSGGGISDIYCIQLAPSTCLDKFYSADDITSQVTSSTCSAKPSTVILSTAMVVTLTPTAAPPDPSPSVQSRPDICTDPLGWCEFLLPQALCSHCIQLKCVLISCRSIQEVCTTVCVPTEPTKPPTQEMECEAQVTDVICRVRLNGTGMVNSASIQPSHTVQISPTHTLLRSASSTRGMLLPLPSSSSQEVECAYEDLEAIGESLLPSGWFYPDPNSKETICMELRLPTSVITAAPTMTPPFTPNCIPIPSIATYVENELTECGPMPDDFNPCEDLLGNSNFLRAAIWFVIILGVIGNGLVIFVFVTHAVIIRRTKIKFFPMHFLYANLATADFLMSVYLLTIASVDVNTKGHFTLDDVEWRTGPGCGFAGFCAITSTVISVYTLVVITSERLYTITAVMHRRQISKQFALVVMMCGWTFGILMGILPLVGVNNYELVAICLPFDTGNTSALTYIAFLLIMTGLSFIYIGISYGIIFYQVILSPTKRHLVRSGGKMKQWKADLRMSIRMLILVITNFVCWFPIALVSLTAAFGVPLKGIDVATAKIFVVFVFPLNACVNPFLYTLSTTVFKENFILLLAKCGLCRGAAYSRIQSRMYGPPSTISTDTATSRRSSVISQLVALNFTMFSNRRTSLASDNTNNSNVNLRRPSQFSMGSIDDGITAAQLMVRRNSAFSQSSSEEQSPSVTAQSTPSSPTRDEKSKPRHVLTSASSLGVLPEVDEVSDMPSSETMVHLNPGYQDQNDSKLEESNLDNSGKETHSPVCNGRVVLSSVVGKDHVSNITDSLYLQNQLVANNILQTEADSEEQSDTVSVPDDIHIHENSDISTHSTDDRP